MAHDMRQFAAVVLVVVGFGAVLRAAPARSAAPTVCGSPGRPACPLQAWMREQLALPYATRRFDELAGNAVALVAFNPDPKGWRDWDELAQDVARAAKAHDEVQTLRACTRCHHTYRREYLAHYRERALQDARRP
jgi:hypothetical protein